MIIVGGYHGIRLLEREVQPHDLRWHEAAEKSTVYLIGILILALKMALYQFFKFKSL